MLKYMFKRQNCSFKARLSHLRCRWLGFVMSSLWQSQTHRRNRSRYQHIPTLSGASESEGHGKSRDFHPLIHRIILELHTEYWSILQHIGAKGAKPMKTTCHMRTLVDDGIRVLCKKPSPLVCCKTFWEGVQRAYICEYKCIYIYLYHIFFT